MSQAPVTDERIDALLQELDRIAREHDVYEYGLPLHSMDDDGAPMSKLREAVRTWIADGVPVVSPDAQQQGNGGVQR